MASNPPPLPSISRSVRAAVAGTSFQGGVIRVQSDDDRRAEEWRLVQAAQGGDLHAFEKLYRENERKVFGLCFRMASDQGSAPKRPYFRDRELGLIPISLMVSAISMA